MENTRYSSCVLPFKSANMRFSNFCIDINYSDSKYTAAVIFQFSFSLINAGILPVLDTRCIPQPTSKRITCKKSVGGRNVCESRGCCFDNSIPGVKWCFRRQGEIPHSESDKRMIFIFPYLVKHTKVFSISTVNSLCMQYFSGTLYRSHIWVFNSKHVIY